MTWADYVGVQQHRAIGRAVVALDSAEHRIAVQVALPARSHNAWTQPGDLGVSRHGFLGEEACLACLYMPNAPRPHQDVLIAMALGFATDDASVQQLRELLVNNRPVGEAFVRQVSEKLSIGPDVLLPHADQPLHSFYVRAVCGGITLTNGAGRPPIEAPLAFQSALAGVALAADLVAETGRLRTMPVATKTVLNVLKPIGKHLNFMVAKSPAAGPATCPCHDQDFIRAYCAKHGVPRPKLKMCRAAATVVPQPTTPTTTSGTDGPTLGRPILVRP